MDIEARIQEIKGEIRAIYKIGYSFFPIEIGELNMELNKLEDMNKSSKKDCVKITKSGDFKVTISLSELDSLINMIDSFQTLSMHPGYKPFVEIYNISADKLRVRFMNPIKYEGQTMKFSRIEAVILSHQYYSFFNDPSLARIMMEIHQKLS